MMTDDEKELLRMFLRLMAVITVFLISKREERR